MDEIYAETQRAQAEEIREIRQEAKRLHDEWGAFSARIDALEVRAFMKTTPTVDDLREVFTEEGDTSNA